MNTRILPRLFLVFVCLLLGWPTAPGILPLTGQPAPSAADQAIEAAPLPDLQAFVRQVSSGHADQVTGIYVEGVLALPVVQQPSGQPGYVSNAPDRVTQFGAASTFGSLGFLAHNTLAGAYFFAIRPGDVIFVIYGDGHSNLYAVEQIRRFRAVTPTSPYSNFVDLDQGLTLTYTDLFYQTYGVSGRLVLQTCIAAEGDDSWGRLFIIATPYLPVASNLH